MEGRLVTPSRCVSLAAQRPACAAPAACSSSRVRHRPVRSTSSCRAMDDGGGVGLPASLQDNAAELEAKMEEFLRRQALKESGDAYVAPVAATAETVLGADVVSDEEAKQYCRDVVGIIKRLQENRDMTVNEIKLTIAIEDPRSRERRESLGIEEGSGVSRDEMAAALNEVAEGRIPKDRIALRELRREMSAWPFLDLEQPPSNSPSQDYSSDGTGGSARPGWRAAGVRPPVGRDSNEAPQSFTDLLPDWVGYGFLYFVSVIPVLIAGSVVVILFVNSLK